MKRSLLVAGLLVLNSLACRGTPSPVEGSMALYPALDHGPVPSSSLASSMGAPASSAPSIGPSGPVRAWMAAPMVGESSSRLSSNPLFNPMPGGQLSGYSADTGLDISGYKKSVFALAAGVLEYAEAGHTRWKGRGATTYTVRLRFDTPIPWKEHLITHAYYGHLFSLVNEQKEGQSPLLHVEGGQLLGVSGWANQSPHLHLGLLLDGHVDQESWTYILGEDEVRAVLGDMKNGQRLPGGA